MTRKALLPMLVGAFCGFVPFHTLATVTLDPKPQAYSSTCQSYSIAYALSAADPKYGIDSAAQLRTQELKVRQAVSETAAELGLSPSHHEVWRKTVVLMTGGRWKLNTRYFPDQVDLFEEATKHTNTWDAGQSLGASYFGVSKPVMTSVSRVERTSYAAGHIVTILGLDMVPRSPKRMAILNSAIKHGDAKKLACNPGDLEGDYRYSAQAAVVSDFDLKSFNGKYLLMWISK